MNGWRVFKYSRRMEREGDEKSFCGVDLETMSQVILHSQPDSQGIKKERWLHVFTEGSKTLELILSPFMLEVRLYVVSAVRQELVILERIKLDGKWDIKTCVNKRAFRYTCGERRFQIVFFSKEEVEVFGTKVGCSLGSQGLDAGKIPVIERLRKAVEEGKKISKTSKYKDKKKLIEEFLLLLFETPE